MFMVLHVQVVMIISDGRMDLVGWEHKEGYAESTSRTFVLHAKIILSRAPAMLETEVMDAVAMVVHAQSGVGVVGLLLIMERNTQVMMNVKR